MAHPESPSRAVRPRVGHRRRRVRRAVRRQALARAPVDVTLIDRHNYHLFQPLLYQVATARPVAGRHRLADPRHPARASRTSTSCWARCPASIPTRARSIADGRGEFPTTI